MDRANPAAAWVVCGAIFGSMAIYCGGNVGAGPTIWTTIVPAVVAEIAWVFAWAIIELMSHPSEMIAIDRDVACAIRHAGDLLASGLILGRSIAGDWTSWQSTFVDAARLAWPLALLVIAAVVLNRMMRPNLANPQPAVVSAGLIPAIILVVFAVGDLAVRGPADIGKHVVTYEQYTNQK
jgi:hypothetical protein